MPLHLFIYCKSCLYTYLFIASHAFTLIYLLQVMPLLDSCCLQTNKIWLCHTMYHSIILLYYVLCIMRNKCNPLLHPILHPNGVNIFMHPNFDMFNVLPPS